MIVNWNIQCKLYSSKACIGCRFVLVNESLGSIPLNGLLDIGYCAAGVFVLDNLAALSFLERT